MKNKKIKKDKECTTCVIVGSTEKIEPKKRHSPVFGDIELLILTGEKVPKELR